MNEEILNKRIKAYYQNKKLPQDSLESLKKLIEKNNTEYSKASVSVPARWFDFLDRLGFSSIPKLVTAFSCLVVVSLVTWQIITQNKLSNRITQTAILKEITMNHTKSLTPEFKGIDIQTLGILMPKLDFSPVVPDIVGTMKLKFIGARYCSIYGNLAVQLKFKTVSGNICSLYQTPLTELLLSIKETRIKSDNIVVKLWHEEGLFMAIAGILN